MRRIVRDLRRAFPLTEIKPTSKQHLRLRLPSARSVFASATPSCSFAMRNVRADVRRRMAADTTTTEEET